MITSTSLVRRIGTRHLDFLTDDFGIWQHTRAGEIDRQHGYALDDSARALVAALELGDTDKAEIYLRFLEIACTKDRIINFFGPDRQPLDKPWSEDALGEAYWGLTSCVRKGFEVDQAQMVITAILPRIKKFQSVRGRAYALVGAIGIDEGLARRMGDELVEAYRVHSGTAWEWVEDELSYANAIFPYALLLAGQWLAEDEYKKVGFAILNFLNSETRVKGVPIAIGCKGWYPRGGRKALFDQQPIDPAYQVLANVAAYKASKNRRYLDEARVYLEWFWGNNLLNLPLIDVHDESVHDGLLEKGINVNRGSENIACYLLAQEALRPYVK